MRKLVIAGLTLGVLLVMGAFRAADLARARTASLAAAESRAANLAVIIAAYLGETFAAGDASLRQLALHSQRVGGPGAPASSWSPSLASAKAGLTSIGAITIVDRHGLVRHSTRPEIVGQSRQQDMTFRKAIEGAGPGLLIGEPFASLATPPELLIPIGRRLETADGRFDGVVVASFFPSVPQRFFRSVDVGHRGSMWVFHPEGTLLFHEPSDWNRIGESARTNPIFEAAARRGSGTLRVPLEAGGASLISAFHVTTAPPLVVAVSFDQDEVLADWVREATSAAVVYVVIAITLVATVVVLFRQIDAKRRMERALADAQQQEAVHLREANDRLAKALEREQTARREAERASALKDEFLMTISHELRTPLTAIYGWTRMLTLGAVSERQRDAALRTIERNARAQVRLIDDLLDVSGAAAGKVRLDVRAVDLARVVEEAVDTVVAAADAKRIVIGTSVDPAAREVLGDANRLQQIVWNLLSNAVKFTPAGGRVDVAVRRAGDDVEIAVSDTGIGISPEFLPHVFDRFRQEDAGTKRRAGGLGLGLAIVRNLAELHGGSVSAQSDGRDRGSIFVVRLPSPVPAAAHAQPSGQPRADVPVRELRLDGIDVLVVDDDGEARELFTAILERAGATVSSAASAADALALLQHSTPDVLLTDIEMPSEDGYGLLGEAVALARARNERLAAVAVTAYSRPEDEARSLAAGFRRHVQKPVEPAELVEVVHSICHGAQPGASGLAAQRRL